MRAKQTEPGHCLNSDRLYVIEDDFNSIDFPKPFDRIISIGVFEHVSNFARGLEKLRRLLIRVYENSPYYQAKFDKAKVAPDAFDSLEV